MFLLQKCGVGFAQHLKAQSTVLNKGDFKDLESSIVDRVQGHHLHWFFTATKSRCLQPAFYRDKHPQSSGCFFGAFWSSAQSCSATRLVRTVRTIDMLADGMTQLADGIYEPPILGVQGC